MSVIGYFRPLVKVHITKVTHKRTEMKHMKLMKKKLKKEA